MLTRGSAGRWFATQQLKLLIAYVTLNYDIEPTQRRRYFVFGDNTWLDRSLCIRVRRRKRS